MSKSVEMLLLAALVASTASAGEWSRFESQEGAFSIDLPSAQVDEQPSTRFRTPDGVLPKKTIHCDWEGGSVSVSWADYPQGLLDKYSIQELLDHAVEHIEKRESSFHREIARGRIDLSGHPGLELRISQPEVGFVTRTRVFLARRRMYQVVVVIDANVVGQEAVDRILSSFSLTGES